MNSRTSKLLRALFLVVGLGIVLAAFLFNRGEGALTVEQKFLWINIAAIVVAVYVPLFFIRPSVSESAASLALLWVAVAALLVTGITITVCVKNGMVNVKLGIASELVMLVIFLAANIIAGVVAHAKKKKRLAEDGPMSFLSQIKNSSQMLTLKASSLNDSFAEEKKRIAAVAEEIAGISSIKDVNASKSEQDILVKLTSVSSLMNEVIAGGNADEFKKKLTVLETTVKQRKQFES